LLLLLDVVHVKGDIRDMPEESRRALRPGEAARQLGVSTRTVQRWLRSGRLPAVVVGSRLMVGAIAGPPGIRPTPARSIRRLLVANRGELVARITRTARSMGVVTLALAPEDQWHTWWSRQANGRVPLPTSYLDPWGVLEAARRAGADAIHPGYGFLAEDADFAEAVIGAGLVWVGPPPSAMRAVGDKAAARRLAASVGVAVLPGYDGEDQKDATLAAEADRIGYPLLVKPSAGGGGMGMQLVARSQDLVDAVARARREAQAAFGDARLLLERQLDEARHVEVQLLLDAQGGAVHLGERDCSLQRRRQKVVEETPAPGVDARTRAQLGEAGIRIAKAAGYQGAGTAEFLIDAQGGAWFLELNARLQVEHPITELVTGRDLVADQLRIASGEPLGFTQSSVALRGHAIEARLYAEDPWSGFAPAAGAVLAARWPSGDGIRVDAGVGPGDVIGTRYDPLLAKVAAAGPSRPAALERLASALEATSLIGVTTNRGFLRAILNVPEMRDGAATTALVDRAWGAAAAPSLDAAFATAAAVLAPGRTGFRLNARPRVRVSAAGQVRTVDVDHVRQPALPWAVEDSGVAVDLDGLCVRASLASPPTVEQALARDRQSVTGAADDVRAPMPGSVREIRIEVGSPVTAGETVLVLEAMKMEHAVMAPVNATVTRLHVSVGDQVDRGDILVELA
jgi:geranyl-CoA carboxylase alpha subunit